MADTRVEVARFAVAGVLGLITDVAALYLALALGMGPFAGRAVSFLCAVAVTWQFNRRYTFSSKPGISAWREWWNYLAAMLLGGAVNYGVYSALILTIRDVPLLPLAAVAAGSLAGMTVNFVNAKYFIFRSR
ncbi:GtrA family protein [Massilia sp. R2A-15]|uniref:GtrA family protein n=1 Tax=Massilia sp. R2A-15 TaxID=3064278 RepID=UPI002733AFE7|nr:GtrA family protein [Massilia sp. R2A-15]WLI88267.1 GtrA family protein [Massilia sp. R2A-15]